MQAVLPWTNLNAGNQRSALKEKFDSAFNSTFLYPLQRQTDSSTRLANGARNIISVKEFLCNGKTFIFKRTQNFIAESRDGYVCIDFRPCEIYIAEKSYEEAIRSLKEELLFVWDEYANEENDLLDKGARELKMWLRANVRNVI